MMSRRFTIDIHDDLSDADYTDLANALWMLLRVTPYEFGIVPDDHTLAEVLNGAWDQYGKDDQGQRPRRLEGGHP